MQVRRFLSAGAAGGWYFDWVAQNYGGSIDRHFGVEAFQSQPPDLPENVVWIASHLDRLGAVPDNSVDLVIAGQLVEHLWAHELSSFLLEAWRVLRAGGRFVIDSPNLLTRAARLAPPRAHRRAHGMGGATDDEACGVCTVSVNGLWRCVDAVSGVPQRLEAETSLRRPRVETAWHDPSDAFVWWLVVKKAASARHGGAQVVRQVGSCIAASRRFVRASPRRRRSSSHTTAAPSWRRMPRSGHAPL